MHRAQRGDVAAFEQLYRENVGGVTALVRRMAGPADAAELVQDIFVRAWEQLGTFRHASKFSTWLHSLGVNLLLNRFRSTRRADAFFAADGNDVVASATRPPADVASQLDLEQAIASLPEGARIVFVLHDIEGYKHEEIARMTGTAVGSCRAQLWRARRHLMNRLER